MRHERGADLGWSEPGAPGAGLGRAEGLDGGVARGSAEGEVAADEAAGVAGVAGSSGAAARPDRGRGPAAASGLEEAGLVEVDGRGPGAGGAATGAQALPLGPRVLALHLPGLPLQRLARSMEPASGGARPVAVVEEGRVVACDAPARAEGVRPGQTLAQALAACGALRPVPHAPAADLAALRGLAEALLGLAPAVEVAAPDTLLLDAGAAHLLGGGPEEGERRLLVRVKAVAADLGYRSRAALASGRGPARALARHGAAALLRVAAGQEARALAALPLGALGLGAAVEARLRAVGVDGVGALARLPPEGLALRFGAAGAAAARLARGDDPTPLVPYLSQTFPEEAIELEGAVESAEPILFVLSRLVDRVAARLAGRGLGASRLKLTLALEPRGEERVLVPLARPSATPARWLPTLRERVLLLRLPGAVTGVRLTVVEAAACPVAQLAFGDRPEVAAALEVVLARLGGRLGDRAVLSAEPLECHRPEVAWRSVPFRPPARGPGGGATGWDGERRDGARSAEGPREVEGGREGEGALGAGARAAGGAGRASVEEIGLARPGPDGQVRPTRLLPAPLPVLATGEGGRVTALRLGGRVYLVHSMEGPERLSGEWWGSPFDRDYYRARVEGLGECWLYRDGADGRLWLHGFFD